jgi:hypothetical protein
MNKELSMVLSDGTTYNMVKSGYIISPDTNYYIAASVKFSDKTVTFYLKNLDVNGTIQESISNFSISSLNPIQKLVIADEGDDVLEWNFASHGFIDEIRLANHALSSSELLINNMRNPLTAPVLISPVQNAIDQSFMTTFRWAAVSGALVYNFQLSTSPDFLNKIIFDSTTNQSYANIVPLNSGTKYYWRVNAADSIVNSSWSETINFTTFPPIPSTPILLTPINYSSNQQLDPTISWSSVPGATLYHLQVSQDSNFNSTSIDDSLVLTTIKAPLLNRNTTYFWRACSKNSGGTSAWSEVRSFTTIPPATGAPILSSPANAATEQLLSLLLSWNAVSGAASYRTQLSTAADFSVSIADDSTLTTTSKTIGPLSNGMTYYWRVNAKNSGGTSAWSEVRSFTTISALPEPVTLVSPIVDSMITTDSVCFVWNKNSGVVDKYYIEVYSDSVLLTRIFADSTVADTMIVCSALQNNSAYWWHIKAHNSAGWGNVNPARKFKVNIPITAVIPVKNSVDMRYVSGTNGIIRYGLSADSRVLIKMHNLQGKLLRTIVYGEQNAGTHQVLLRDVGLANGFYILVFRAGDFSRTGMISIINH